MIKKISILLFFSAAMVLVGCDKTAEKIPEKTEAKLLSKLISGNAMQQLDQSDENMARENAIRTLNTAPDGIPQTWRNPNTGKSGRSFAMSKKAKSLCRELHSVAFDEFGDALGRERKVYCKDSKGNWRPAC